MGTYYARHDGEPERSLRRSQRTTVRASRVTRCRSTSAPASRSPTSSTRSPASLASASSPTGDKDPVRVSPRGAGCGPASWSRAACARLTGVQPPGIRGLIRTVPLSRKARSPRAYLSSAGRSFSIGCAVSSSRCWLYREAEYRVGPFACAQRLLDLVPRQLARCARLRRRCPKPKALPQRTSAWRTSSSRPPGKGEPSQRRRAEALPRGAAERALHRGAARRHRAPPRRASRQAATITGYLQTFAVAQVRRGRRVLRRR